MYYHGISAEGQRGKYTELLKTYLHFHPNFMQTAAISFGHSARLSTEAKAEQIVKSKSSAKSSFCIREACSTDGKGTGSKSKGEMVALPVLAMMLALFLVGGPVLRGFCCCACT